MSWHFTRREVLGFVMGAVGLFAALREGANEARFGCASYWGDFPLRCNGHAANVGAESNLHLLV
jgi:hypothetical protein